MILVVSLITLVLASHGTNAWSGLFLHTKQPGSPHHGSQIYKPDGNPTITTVDFHLPEDIKYSGLAAINDTIYVIGGRSDDAHRFVYRTIYSINITTNVTTFENVAPMPQAKIQFTTLVVNGHIWLCGGYIDSKLTDTCDDYDPITNTWTAGFVNLTSPEYFPRLIKLGDFVYTLGGENTAGAHKLDLKTNKWTSITLKPPPDIIDNTYGLLSTGDGNTILTCGGKISSKCYLYDTRDDLWAPTHPIAPDAYDYQYMFTYHGRYYAITYSATLVFSIDKDFSWHALPTHLRFDTHVFDQVLVINGD